MGMKTMTATNMIITDQHGKPIERPRREDFKSVGDFAEAMSDYQRRLDSAHSHGTEEGVRQGLKGKKSEGAKENTDSDEVRKAKVATMMKQWGAKGR